jgi:molybdopterin biosynthesis enzyme MoaB
MCAIRTGILCIDEVNDEAAQAIRHCLHRAAAGVLVVSEQKTASQRYWIEELLRRWCDEEELDLVLTVGATLPAPGPSTREIIPEATLAVVERLLPGLSEEMRAYAGERTPLAFLDRGVAGIRGRSLIVNLPAGGAPAALFLEAIAGLIAPIVAHLQERPDAMRLADAMGGPEPNDDQGQPVDDEESGQDVTTLQQRPGLDEREFIEFLRRRGEKRI